MNKKQQEQTNEFLISSGKQALEVLIESNLIYGSATQLIPFLTDRPDVIQLLRLSLQEDVRNMQMISDEGSGFSDTQAYYTQTMRRKNTILLELTGKGEL